MLKRLVARLTKKKSLSHSEKLPNDKHVVAGAKQLEVLERSKHSLSRRQMDDNALKVLYRLRKGGFEAYLVGGGIRDLLLGHTPKDFDVVTNAKPEQVRALFSNARLIGKRFKLVHVVFGREIIEVATFRTAPTQDSKHHTESTQGMIVRDNVYGSKNEDALRRDFTINALYYSINDFSLHNYFSGLEDLKHKRLRIIGDPTVRYREDPVRMLRAARFAAKLDFGLDEKTEAPIYQLGHLLKHVSNARLYEESLKLFISGHAQQTFHHLRKLELLEYLLPSLAYELAQSSHWDAFIKQALTNTDNRIRQELSVNPAYLFATFLWPSLQRNQHYFQAQGMMPTPALHQAASVVLQNQQNHTAIPKRLSSVIKEIWDLQVRLKTIKGQSRKAEKLIEHPKFRAGYDFLLLRDSVSESDSQPSLWWTHFLESNPIAIALFAKRQSQLNASYHRKKKSPEASSDSNPKEYPKKSKFNGKKNRRKPRRRSQTQDQFGK